ncbi:MULTISPECIES: pyridoxamine 5'-phosphate oxidase family protein [unclassified Kribbella]|uniref:helix-turn-helix domain-containing protein n=1 Tax=unclassified Kribbella TaxID=2644121 RepID=UPI0033DDD16E
MGTGSRSLNVPGDLGIRVRQRRTALGLSTAEVAERADMSARRIERIETSPGMLTARDLVRLAHALDTTVSDLCAPPRPRTARATRLVPLLEPMRRDECVELIESGVVGRIAFNRDDELIVIPINYCYLNDLIIFRTAADSAVAQYDVAPIAFELDSIDEGVMDGWSVLVNGTVRPATDGEAEAAGSRVDPWAGGTRDTYVAIAPHRITGRRIRSW